jgi:pyruvate-formate lyase-activating enzyme
MNYHSPRQSRSNASHHGGSTRLATIFLTSDCNLNCLYCYARENEFQPGEVWDVTLARPLLDHLAQRGYRISIGGGEPLTHPDLMLAIAREAAHRQMGVSLLTNGYLLDRALLRALYRAGVNWVQISADSAVEAEQFAGLLAAGERLGLQMAVGTVLLPERSPEIKYMYDIIASGHAAGWRILRYTPLTQAPRMSQAPTNSEWIEALFALEESLRPLDDPVQIRYEPSVVPLDWLRTRPAEQRLDICGGRRARRLFLYPNGDAFACGLPRRKGIALGNFKSDWETFERLLDHIPVREYQHPEIETKLDAYCSTVCLGGCVQMRGNQPCDPRCEWEKGLVPICCFEKLLLAPGRHAQGPVTYPSLLYEDVLKVN